MLVHLAAFQLPPKIEGYLKFTFHEKSGNSTRLKGELERYTLDHLLSGIPTLYE